MSVVFVVLWCIYVGLRFGLVSVVCIVLLWYALFCVVVCCYGGVVLRIMVL